MAKKEKKDTPENKVIEFVLEDLEPISSLQTPKTEQVEASEKASSETDIERRSLILKELDLPKLPVLERQDRARLHVQSPNKMFFYWSLKANPFQALSRTLGKETAGYTLALRLIETETEREELHAIESEGSYWFHAFPGRTYRAEIGFYSPSRPFVRILFSNTVTTPRRSPSRRAASESEWRVTPDKFAEVLDSSGFSRDAFDVAIAGDDPVAADQLTHVAFADFIGAKDYPLHDVSAEDLRLAMHYIATGRAIEDLRWKIGPALFAILQANAENIESENAAAVLSEYFDIDAAEFDEEEFPAAVFGASLVHFPKKLRARHGYSPVSSGR